MVKAVLLDVDGTLVLSNDAHAKAWVEAFALFGHDIAYETVRPLIGMGGDKLMPKAVPGLSKDTKHGKEISQFRSQLFRDTYAPELQAAPGSRELVEQFLAVHLELIVATSAKEAELEILLDKARVKDLLNKATTSSDADQSKPDPDIVKAALEKIKMPPQEVLMLGDTPYDIEAATRSGVGVVAVRCGGWNDEDLKGALAVYDDPADLLANFKSSPFNN